MGYAVSNVLGQIVDSSRTDLAPGYYMLTDQSIEEMVKAGEIPNCGNLDANGNYVGLRPGFMVVGTDEDGNLLKIDTCAGNLVENHLPDVVLVDNAWKPYVKYVNIAVLIVIVLLILRETR
jgi:hypothetical protein